MDADPIWARLLPECVAVEEGPIADRLAALLPEELADVGAAVEKRRFEYASGRACAHRALARLGFAHAPLKSGPDRAPLWPDGATGSISHMAGWCAAAVARATEVVALGIDLEPDEPLEPSLWRLVATDREQAELERSPASSRGARARLLFCAKEAFYKCQYPATRVLLDFRDVECELTDDAFRVTLLRASGPFAEGVTFRGRHGVASGRRIAAMAWPARSGSRPA